jgi:GT2 family glycosyltransferase
MDVFLVDDGSSDGTADAVSAIFPPVRIIRGDGTLFWGGAMRAAWLEAAKGDYDGYLWLNDDTELATDAVSRLCLFQQNKCEDDRPPPIVVGTLVDPDSGGPTYGGVDRLERVLDPGTGERACHTMNGNCVLVPSEVYELIGAISAEFTHNLGDFDYGLRAKAAGVEIWCAPGYYGFCRENAQSEPWASRDRPLLERWKILHSTKGLPPRQWILYNRRHRRGYWVLALVKLYLRVLFPGPWAALKRSRACRRNSGS